MGSKARPKFLTIYTVSATDVTPDSAAGHIVIGSWLSRGDAIRECADYIMEQLHVCDTLWDICCEDERFLEAAKRSGEVLDSLVGMEESAELGEAIRAMVVDELGGEGCFVVRSEDGTYEFRYDVDENDVEDPRNEGLQLYTCITSGKSDDGDEEWDRPFPEPFLTEAQAVKCAIDDLKACLEGYGAKEKKEIVAEAKKSIEKDGCFEFALNDSRARRWDIWSTPLDIGSGAKQITRRK